MLAFQQSIQGIATVAAYADFETAPAITTASILANIIGGVLKLPIAKTLNLWGRAEGYLVMFAIYLIGIIVLAASSGPNSYAAVTYCTGSATTSSTSSWTSSWPTSRVYGTERSLLRSFRRRSSALLSLVRWRRSRS